MRIFIPILLISKFKSEAKSHSLMHDDSIEEERVNECACGDYHYKTELHIASNEFMNHAFTFIHSFNFNAPISISIFSVFYFD